MISFAVGSGGGGVSLGSEGVKFYGSIVCV
jgi:hypothetical protein